MLATLYPHPAIPRREFAGTFTGLPCNRRQATAMGAIARFLVMGTVVVFGIGYAALFTAFDNDAWWVGALLGIGHGLVVGLLAMPMMPAMHPRMTGDLSGAAMGSDDQGQSRSPLRVCSAQTGVP